LLGIKGGHVLFPVMVMLVPLLITGGERLEWTSSHQCTSWGWSCSSHLKDEPKTHLPLPKVFGFFSFFSTPKFFPPTYLFPTYLPPPTYFTSFCVHSIIRTWERLKWEPPLSELRSA
jgi:hypothetical protein